MRTRMHTDMHTRRRAGEQREQAARDGAAARAEAMEVGAMGERDRQQVIE